jgi:hypothetical protein
VQTSGRELAHTHNECSQVSTALKVRLKLKTKKVIRHIQQKTKLKTYNKKNLWTGIEG